MRIVSHDCIMRDDLAIDSSLSIVVEKIKILHSFFRMNIIRSHSRICLIHHLKGIRKK